MTSQGFDYYTAEQLTTAWAFAMTAQNNGRPEGSPGEMTLEDALAVYLYFLEAEDTIGEREEQILDGAWKIIERGAKRAIELSESGSAQ